MALTRGGSETVLIAEDEDVVRAFVLRALQDAGYQTFAAADGEEAVALFKQHSESIDLVLLDVVMPKLKGLAAYQRMIQIRPGIAVIFCSGYDPMADDAGLLAAEGQRLLPKPFDPTSLLRTVR